MGAELKQRQAEGSAYLADTRSGRTYLLALPLMSIGRHDAGVVIDDPYLSRRHARIVADGGDFWLEDLASANGSFVNQRPVTTPTRLEEGDELVLGATTLRFVRSVPLALLGGAHA